MEHLQELLDEWTAKAQSNQVSDNDHTEWRITIKQALKSANSDIFSDFQPEIVTSTQFGLLMPMVRSPLMTLLGSSNAAKTRVKCEGRASLEPQSLINETA